MAAVNSGHLIVALSAVFFIIASYATFFSAFFPLSGNLIFDALAMDSHYKYFAVLIVPTTSYFVIGNWVGWQYYRNS
ncbi:hypothetical protein BDQ12DRAFT_676552 [Crucibulum laeve]|uniref:Uncharacterized protein n=1 Tax=Crucibulum laeve TaxID=68775 RepID=A0A5C3MB23_9AGAR|nr:hypothetical protein BDQ12DRAFT_676552 [Crucibulum laeve]